MRTSTLVTIRHALRDTLATRRAERRERQRLERELASYSSPAERLELEAMIERYAPEETREIQVILTRQAVARAAGQRAA